jgi:hypothetical protein
LLHSEWDAGSKKLPLTLLFVILALLTSFYILQIANYIDSR